MNVIPASLKFILMQSTVLALSLAGSTQAWSARSQDFPQASPQSAEQDQEKKDDKDKKDDKGDEKKSGSAAKPDDKDKE